MKLKSLLLCADEKIVRVLRRTLGDLEIEVELCASPEMALRKLTRERFEAIIVDCAGPGAADVLRFARTSPCNKRTVAVAILDVGSGMRSAFEVGANFVLYKPVSVERAKSSFRAARALMKKERRRNTRVEVRIPEEMLAPGWEGDGGLGWEGAGTQVGLGFQEGKPEFARQLGEWLGRNSPDAEKDDPPARCQLTDLSLGGCYFDLASPFPVSTRVTLSMRAAGVELRAEGIVRVMHPDKGMGVEFSQRTAEHRALLEKVLNLLTEHRDVQPELMVEPEGLEAESANTLSDRAIGEVEDALLGLFRNQAALPTDSFLAELRKQRGVAAGVSV